MRRRARLIVYSLALHTAHALKKQCSGCCFALVLALATPIAADEDFRAAEPSTDFLAAVPATILTDSNWTEFVTQDDVPTFVMFHAPWCGHCRNLAPTWEKLSAKLAEEDPPAARIAKYDATANSGMPVRLFFLDSFPTLIVFANQGGDHRAHRYSGPRQLAVLEESARGGWQTGEGRVLSALLDWVVRLVVDANHAAASGPLRAALLGEARVDGPMRRSVRRHLCRCVGRRHYHHLDHQLYQLAAGACGRNVSGREGRGREGEGGLD